MFSHLFHRAPAYSAAIFLHQVVFRYRKYKLLIDIKDLSDIVRGKYSYNFILLSQGRLFLEKINIIIWATTPRFIRCRPGIGRIFGLLFVFRPHFPPFKITSCICFLLFVGHFWLVLFASVGRVVVFVDCLVDC